MGLGTKRNASIVTYDNHNEIKGQARLPQTFDEFSKPVWPTPQQAASPSKGSIFSKSGLSASGGARGPGAASAKSSRDTQPSYQQNFGNDYSDAFVHRGILPQNWVQNVDEPLVGYPKLQRLHELKREQFSEYAMSAVGINCAEGKIASMLRTMGESHMQFDVMMVHGCIEAFPLEQLQALSLDRLAARPSLVFLWVPASKIAEGRQLMEQWGYRRGEDIAYVVNSLDSPHAPAADSWDSDERVFRSTTWHCLMGLKGTLRRSTNTELIHCNVDTDVIIEKTGHRNGVVPDEIYSIVENFTSMARKLHVLPVASAAGLPVRPRQGWVVVSPDVFSVGELDPSKFSSRTTIPVSSEIDILRPQTPPAR